MNRRQWYDLTHGGDQRRSAGGRGGGGYGLRNPSFAHWPSVRRAAGRRARRYSARRNNPKIQALKDDKEAIRRQYQKEVASAQGAVNMAQNALGGVKLKGLGRYRDDVKKELQAREQDMAQSVPFLTAEAKATRAGDMASLRSEIVNARITKEKDRIAKRESLLSSAFTDAQARQNRLRGDKPSKKELAREIKLALNEGMVFVNTALHKDEVPTAADWQDLERRIAGEEISAHAGRRALTELMRRYYNSNRRAKGYETFNRREWVEGMRRHNVYPYGGDAMWWGEPSR